MFSHLLTIVALSTRLGTPVRIQSHAECPRHLDNKINTSWLLNLASLRGHTRSDIEELKYASVVGVNG